MCIGVMYSGENNVCAWCYSEFISTSGELKNICLTTVGIEPTTFAIPGPMLCQLSDGIRSVQVCDIPKLSPLFLRYHVILMHLSEFSPRGGEAYPGGFYAILVSMLLSREQSLR